MCSYRDTYVFQIVFGGKKCLKKRHAFFFPCVFHSVFLAIFLCYRRLGSHGIKRMLKNLYFKGKMVKKGSFTHFSSLVCFSCVLKRIYVTKMHQLLVKQQNTRVISVFFAISIVK